MARHVDGAAGQRIAALGHQDDFAVFEAQAAGLNEAFVVDHGVEQAVAPLGGEVDRTTVGLDEALVFCQGVESGFVHFDGEQGSVVQAQGESATGCQGHSALGCRDVAFVDGFAASQHHVAAVSSLDVALVDDAIAAAATEHPLAVGVFGGIGSRRSQQATYAHFRAFTKQHAVLVEQEHLAIGLQAAKNF